MIKLGEGVAIVLNVVSWGKSSTDIMISKYSKSRNQLKNYPITWTGEVL
jgi:acyl-CoA hydrolase